VKVPLFYTPASFANAKVSLSSVFDNSVSTLSVKRSTSGVSKVACVQEPAPVPILVFFSPASSFFRIGFIFINNFLGVHEFSKQKKKQHFSTSFAKVSHFALTNSVQNVTLKIVH
jgi:hypothetical protein